VTLKGDRQFLVGGQKLSGENCTYTFHFTYQGARLLLSEISKEKESALFGGG
jgi:conjugal transfer pilus assembly protein TraE